MVLAIFTEAAVPKTGLEPTVTIYRLDTNAIVIEDVDMVEVGSGQYSYDFTAWDSSLDYSVIVDSVTLTGSERYCYTSISSSRVIEDSLTSDDILRLLISKGVGNATGGGSTQIRFRSLDNTVERISMGVDSFGNRQSVVLDAD